MKRIVNSLKQIIKRSILKHFYCANITRYKQMLTEIVIWAEMHNHIYGFSYGGSGTPTLRVRYRDKLFEYHIWLHEVRAMKDDLGLQVDQYLIKKSIQEFKANRKWQIMNLRIF